MTTTSSARAIDSSNFGKFFIGGQWVAPSTDRVIEVVSPTTENVVFSVVEAAEADLDQRIFGCLYDGIEVPEDRNHFHWLTDKQQDETAT